MIGVGGSTVCKALYTADIGLFPSTIYGALSSAECDPPLPHLLNYMVMVGEINTEVKVPTLHALDPGLIPGTLWSLEHYWKSPPSTST